jgi:hypothetical protein
MTAATPFKPSPKYKELCEYVTNTPRLLSALYDLNLLPEQVSKSAPARQRMLAFILGFKVGAGEVDPR